ncbi:MAG: P-type conjugative transfer protein TrbL [Methylovulum sp.]|nr:MAG: P-type conjugative transfer protein TrbL [Methylovulum sp.]
MRTTVIKSIACLLIVLFSAYSVEAKAAISSTGLLDNVLTSYLDAASAWATTITARASFLFWSLATISMVWTFGMLALRKADIGDFYGEFVRFTVFTGFYWWLLSNGPTMAINIIDSMKTMGGTASGISTALSPSGIVDIGFSIFFTVLDKSTIWSPFDSAVGILISGIILVVMALIGVNMLLLLVSGWILAYAGVFFLGFGGSRWTSDMAIAYFKTVLNIAVQLLTMVLLVGIGKTFVTTYYANMNAAMNLKEMGVMLVVAIVLLHLTNKVPPMIGNLAMGGGAGALGNGFGAGSAMAAASVAGAAMAVGGAAIMTGAANAAGGTQAIMAAYQKASTDYASSGGSSSMSAGLADYQSSNSSISSSSQSSPLAKAMGLTSSGETGSGSTSSQSVSGSQGGRGLASAAKIAVDTGANLAKGVGQVAKDKHESVKEYAQNRIDQTLGGQVATAINNEMPSFGGDSLAGDAPDLQSEVAAFSNRTSPT